MQTSTKTIRQRWLTVEVISITAVGYFLLGYIGQLMAVPPGFATIIWPPAGLALAAVLAFGQRALTGIFIGAFSISVYIRISGGTEINDWLIPVLMALYATLQAHVGYFLVRRFVGLPMTYRKPAVIFRFLFITAVLSTLVGCTLSVMLLLQQGIISEENLLSTWLSWWTGDAIGIIFTLPWLLSLFPRLAVTHFPRSRFTFASLAGFTLSAAVLCTLAINEERNKQTAEFNNDASTLANNLEASVSNATNILYSVAGLVKAEPNLTPTQFRRFTARILDENPVLQGLSWNIRVTGDNVHQLQSQLQRSYAAEHASLEFTITERDANGELIPFTPRPLHVVVAFIEPFADNIKALGYDVYSQASRQEALKVAWQTEQIYPTPPIMLVQNDSQQAGVLLFLPVKSDQKHTFQNGYATGVIRVLDLASLAFSNTKNNNVILLMDPMEGVETGILYSKNLSPAQQQRLSSASLDEQQLRDEFPLLNRYEISLGARSWVLYIVNESIFIYQPWGVHLLLASATLFAGLLGWFMIIVAGYTDEI